jgi:hypothetical protein
MVDWMSFCVKVGYFRPKSRLILVERDLSRPNLGRAPNGIRAHFRGTAGWRKKDRPFCLPDEPQDVSQMILRFRGTRSEVAG